jgi:transposase
MYPAELRERAVRLVREGEAAYGSEWEAICAVAEMLGPTAEMVRRWVRRAEIDAGSRPRLTKNGRERLNVPAGRCARAVRQLRLPAVTKQ